MRHRAFTTILIVLAILAVTATWATADHSKLARDLAEELDLGAPELRVIVSYTTSSANGSSGPSSAWGAP